MKYIDLHVHSIASDGTFTPSELVAYAKEKNLSAFALTDHDSIDGIPEAEHTAKNLNMEIITGIEFSTEYKKKDIHILGLDFDIDNPDMQNYIIQFKELRNLRNHKMVKKLVEMGMEITMEELQSANRDSVITRAHFARLLYEKGYVSQMKEAFEKYIGDNCPCFVPREKITPCEAVSIIQKAGGIPVLAHPILYHFQSYELEVLVEILKKAGLIGLEAIYSTYGSHEELSMRKLARKFNLEISGGSDFHGNNKPEIDLGVGKGNLKIPYSVITNLRKHKSIP